MDWLQILQIIANIAQVFGVIWVFLFGGKAIIDVIQDISRHQPIRKVSATTITNVLLALILLALISLRFPPISNPSPAATPQTTTTFTPMPLPTLSPTPTTAPSPETLRFSLTAGANGATTKQSYTGTIPITVSGTGQVAGKQYSDAFYIYTDDNGQPIPPSHNPNYFSLCINSQPVDRYVQTIPPYNSNHTYTFQINAPGGSLTFGVCDNGASDNSGSFMVTLS